MTTQQQAVDAIFGAFNTAWSVNANYPAVWPGKSPEVEPLKQTNPWTFANIVHEAGKQLSLAGADGKKLWGRKGRFNCEIYVRIGSGTEEAYTLARSVELAFLGKTIDGVVFRSIQLKEMGNHGDWFLICVFVQFEYDEVI